MFVFEICIRWSAFPSFTPHNSQFSVLNVLALRLVSLRMFLNCFSVKKYVITPECISSC